MSENIFLSDAMAGDNHTVRSIQNSIEAQKIHYNNMIDKINLSKDYFGEDTNNRYRNKYGKDLNLNFKNASLQKNYEAIITDIHGDFYSMASSINLSGAATFKKDVFLIYDIVTHQYYTEEECLQEIQNIETKYKEELTLIRNWKTVINNLKQIYSYHVSKSPLTKILNISLNKCLSERNINIANERKKASINLKKYVEKAKEKFSSDNSITIQQNGIKDDYTADGKNEIDDNFIFLQTINNHEYKIVIDRCIDNPIFDFYFDDRKIFSNMILPNFFNLNLDFVIKMFEYEILKDKHIFYVFPKPIINENFEGEFFDLGDCIDRGPESFACILAYEYLVNEFASIGKNNIHCLLGNHEVSQINVAYVGESAFISEEMLSMNTRRVNKKTLSTGIIKEIENDKGEIVYHSYSHTVFLKSHLPRLFWILKLLVDKEVDKEIIDFESVYNENFQDVPEENQNKAINLFTKNFNLVLDEKLKNTSEKLKNILFKLLTEHFQPAWDKEFQNLSIELRNKLTEFLNKHQTDYFKKLFVIEKSENYLNLYQELANSDFSDYELFLLNFAVGDTLAPFCNNLAIFPYINISAQFWEREIGNEDQLFNVVQHVGHTSKDFIGKINCVYYHDTLRSVGYRTNESRISIFIQNIFTKVIITIEIFIERENYTIPQNPKIYYSLKDTADANAISQKNINYEPKKKFKQIQIKVENHEPILKKDSQNPKMFSSTKKIINAFFNTTLENQMAIPQQPQIIHEGKNSESKIEIIKEEIIHDKQIDESNSKNKLPKNKNENENEIQNENQNSAYFKICIGLGIGFLAAGLISGILFYLFLSTIAAIATAASLITIAAITITATFIDRHRDKKAENKYFKLKSENLSNEEIKKQMPKDFVFLRKKWRDRFSDQPESEEQSTTNNITH